MQTCDILLVGTGGFAQRIACDLAAIASAPLKIACAGRNALRLSLRDLGFEPNDAELAEIYRRVTSLADQAKTVRPRDILGIAHEVIRRGGSSVAAEASSLA